jgi:hypothetical protein
VTSCVVHAGIEFPCIARLSIVPVLSATILIGAKLRFLRAGHRASGRRTVTMPAFHCSGPPCGNQIGQYVALGQQNLFAQSSSLPLLAFRDAFKPVRSTSGMPHEQKRPAVSHPLLSALIAEPRFASSVVQSAARNHSAIIATTTMPQTNACENLLSLSTQHADIRTLHK